MAQVEVKVSRQDRVFRPPDVVDGTVVITTPSRFTHHGIRVTAVGSVVIQPSSKTVGVIESLYSSVKPVILLQKAVDVSAAGKIDIGKTEFPFHISLDADAIPGVLHETYHGVYINIHYKLTAEVVRGYLQKPCTASTEILVVSTVQGRKGSTASLKIPFRDALSTLSTATAAKVEPVSFYITQDTQSHFLLPPLRSGGFKVTGKLPSQCSISEPLCGELVVEHSSVPIRSIDVRLFRLESILVSERTATERTEVQTTQIADGDVCRGMTLPIYIILPRLLTCPTLSAGVFTVEFEISIAITFEAKATKKGTQQADSKQLVASETLPLRLFRR